MENTYELSDGAAGFDAISDEDLQRLIIVDDDENPDAYMSLSSPCYPQQDPNAYMPQSSPSYPQQNSDAFLFDIDGLPEIYPCENPNYLVEEIHWPNLEGDVNLQVENDPKSPEKGWQRIKWTDAMVKLLISIVSYVGWDAVGSSSSSSSSSNPSNEGSHLLTPVKGKWKVISNLMVERGFMVSPHQCEDKFNVLCKKFKRLNDVLGRFNALTAVRNPSLLQAMNVPNKAKAELRKILSCKHLFFEEMCSYFDGDRAHLPHDETLQKSVQYALKGKSRYRYSKEFLDKYTQKGLRRREHGGNAMDIDQSCHQGNERIALPLAAVEGLSNGTSPDLQARLLRVKERTLQIEKEMLELETMRFQWLRMCEEDDKEIHQMKIRNDLMRLENERLKLEIESKEMGRRSRSK